MRTKNALGIGFDEFMSSATEGWSLVAIRGSVERTALAMQRRRDVVRYRTDVVPRELMGHPVICREAHQRRAFLIQLEESPWTIMLRTVDWIRPEDAVGARKLASDLSRTMQGVTLSSIGAYDGAECRLFDNGQEIARVDTDDLTQDFMEFCEQQQLALPGCFIGFDENDADATLYLQDFPLAYVNRIDQFVLKI